MRCYKKSTLNSTQLVSIFIVFISFYPPKPMIFLSCLGCRDYMTPMLRIPNIKFMPFTESKRESRLQTDCHNIHLQQGERRCECAVT